MISVLCSDINDEMAEGGETFLHIVCKLDMPLVVHALLELGADLRTMTITQQTSLHYACIANSLPSCILLVERGAPVNIKDNQLNTPLHLAVSINVAVYLASNGARLELKNFNDVLALNSAIANFTNVEDNDSQQIIQASKEFKKKSNIIEIKEEITLSLVKENDWITDDSSNSCFLCHDMFTMTKRKHHCRVCGLLVCKNCSKKKFCQDKTKEKLRCCDCCYNKMLYLPNTKADNSPFSDEKMKDLEGSQQVDKLEKEKLR